MDKLIQWATALRGCCRSDGLLVVWLKIQGFTFKEVSQQLGIGEEACRRAYNSAIEDIRSHLCAPGTLVNQSGPGDPQDISIPEIGKSFGNITSQRESRNPDLTSSASSDEETEGGEEE